jgi:hypothetical protein
MYWIDNQTDRSLIQAISLVPRPQQGVGSKFCSVPDTHIFGTVVNGLILGHLEPFLQSYTTTNC